VNKVDIVTKMSELSGASKAESERNLEAFLGVVELAVRDKEKLNLVGYFSMDVVDTKERVGRNPATKEEITIPAGKKVKIKVGKRLKDLA
jgi:DNA-binding protein HU-beta